MTSVSLSTDNETHHTVAEYHDDRRLEAGSLAWNLDTKET